MPLLFAQDGSTQRSRTDASTVTLEIALLNNLSDAGLEGGDRQIIEILRQAAGSRTVRLRFFTLPSIPRGAAGRAYVEARYADFSELTSAPIDGLIVTGCEPRARRLSDEAFWPQLADVIDWAEHNTRSTVWSCLAAHAAVLHLDGIERRPLAEKCTGLFLVEPTDAHPLLVDAPAALRVPHSRWNGLDADELEAAGYRILTRGPEIGVDTFVKEWRALFVYLQGHPEYDGDALRREYRRDVMRYLDGTSDVYPSLPVDYFDCETEVRLRAFAECARGRVDPALAFSFPLVPRSTIFRRDVAATLFHNWLGYLHRRPADHAA